MQLDEAASRLAAFSTPSGLTARIAVLEQELRGQTRRSPIAGGADLNIDRSLLEATLQLKDLTGQINTLLHAVGILWSLPHVLQDGETIEKVSLGAGNSPDRHWDLETDRQIAEFTFIRWRGGAEPVRKQKVLANFVALALEQTAKDKRLYVTGSERPLAYLRGRASVTKALARHQNLKNRFETTIGSQYPTVGDLYNAQREHIQIVDLSQKIPEFNVGLVPDVE